MTYNRRTFVKAASLSAAGLSFFSQNLLAKMIGAQDPFVMKSLRNDIGFFTERGGTIGWMINKEAIVVIDTEFPDQSQHLINAIKKMSDRRVDLLINTHHHGDHTSGNIAYKGIIDMLLAHENSKKNQMRVAKERGQEATQLYPDTTFTDTWSKKIGGEMISLRYLGPGHTDGDSVIHFENANIVHMGDLVFNRRFPYIDKSAGASIKNWIAILQQCQQTFDKDTIFIFGHSDNGFGVTGSLADLHAFEVYLSKMLETVRMALKAGKSEESIMKITSIGGAEEWKGNGIGRSLSAALTELTAE